MINLRIIGHFPTLVRTKSGSKGTSQPNGAPSVAFILLSLSYHSTNILQAFW
ncbi:hypothetical protein SAMN05880501_106165 [Ureibacillus xyleni]|uniref:Uncharacterized protein n=1 Tax=Ureibacillus xyleni TaxID=614648 RepID=A0A285SSN7_9BACL|nr:hypothetical protein SAMN05880501_106165 [Ureibacillus xyleni]